MMPPAKPIASIAVLAVLSLAALPQALANGDKGVPSRMAGLEDCAAAGELVDQTLCYGRLARQRDDLAVCQMAEHDGVRQQCIYMLAQHRKDAGVLRIADYRVRFELAPGVEPRQMVSTTFVRSYVNPFEDEVRLLADVLARLDELYAQESPSRRDDALREALQHHLNGDVGRPVWVAIGRLLGRQGDLSSARSKPNSDADGS